MPLAPGPYLHVPISAAETAPFYALRFDREGRSQGPRTQQHLVDALAASEFSDVYLFSHGWNNDWAAALDRYKRFMESFRRLRAEHGLDLGGREYRPLLAGIFWPSTALVLPWERGPEFAADGGDVVADSVDRVLLAELAEDVSPEALPRYYELVESETLDAGEARELIGLVSRVYGGGDPDIEGDPGRDIEETLAAWAMLEARLATSALAAGPADFGAVRPASPSGPEAAGFLDALDPRNLVRGATVWKMKDRAGRVGVDGAGPMLRSMLEATAGRQTRFHLVGHSYGARLLMAALLGQPRPVRSLLLLQPAVNHLCFADQLPNGEPGGFKEVLGRVERPIMTTFSSHDFPLHKTFHLALRRGADLGDIEIAADEPPSDYAALGGYGPRGFSDWREVPIKDPTDPYAVEDGAPRVWAIRGDRRIKGHGDVINDATAWALYNLAET